MAMEAAPRTGTMLQASSIAATSRRLIAVTLVILGTGLAHWSALGGALLGWDDKRALRDFQGYRGLHWSNVEWAFTTLDMAMYRPLTWLSYGLDYQLGGLDAYGFHRTSFLLHVLLAAALFMLVEAFLQLLAPTRNTLFASVVSALFFSLHPLRVQAVAWVSARADVLAAVFLVLSTLAWLQWLRAGHRGARVAFHLLFAMSLLSKPTALGAPLAWLLATQWLRRKDLVRVSPRAIRIDFAIGCIGAGFAAYAALLAKQAWSGSGSGGLPSMPASAAFVALHNAVFPLWKTVWPSSLGYYEPASPFDPFALSYVLGAAGALLLALLLWRLRKQQPGLCLAAIVYLLLLAPTLGIVPFGYEVTADRFSYMPALIFSLMLAPVLMRVQAALPMPRMAALRVVLAGYLITLAAISAQQTLHWKDDRSFWEHNLAINPQCGIAHAGLGDAMLREERIEDARAYYLRARELQPDYEPVLLGLGFIDCVDSHFAEGIEKLETYLTHHPENRRAWTWIGQAYAAVGRNDDARAVREMLATLPADTAP
jgi:tetratricopeptide (TPR) repeat protein